MSNANQLWTDVDRYYSDLFVAPDSALNDALAASAAAGLPDIAVAPNQGKLLNLLVRMSRARRVLEVGTLGGYSTIWMGRALPASGRLVTLELDAKHAAVARANFKNAGLSDKVELREGTALQSLQNLINEGGEPFDFVFIDADKANIPSYFAMSLQLTRVGSVIIVDNVVREGNVIDANSRDASVKGVRRFNQLAAAEARVSVTALQTVGVKGHDGFAIMLVVDPDAAS